ncbi:hypothetical protein N7451_004442 [Penicillium sp. IBT 35674x]|nr:hypothetical protein N7451_004442 [Penicillium sp. IBT 35674x]
MDDMSSRFCNSGSDWPITTSESADAVLPHACNSGESRAMDCCTRCNFPRTQGVWHTGGVPDLIRLYPPLSTSIYKNSPGRNQQPNSDGQEEDAIFTGNTVLGHGTSEVELLGTWKTSLRAMGSHERKIGYPAHGEVIRDLPARSSGELDQKAKREAHVVQTRTRIKRQEQGRQGRGKGSVTLPQMVAATYGKNLVEQVRTMALEPFTVQVLTKLAEDG